MQIKRKLSGIVSAILLMSSVLHADMFNPCDPCNPCGEGGFYVGAEALYWTSCLKDLDVVLSEVEEIATSESNTIVVEINNADYNWKFGYRLFAGYRDLCEGWDLEGIYTHWDHSATNKHIFNALILPNNEFGNISHRLIYNNIDALVSRVYTWCPQSTFRPFVGFRGFWIDQHHHFNLGNVSGDGFFAEKLDYLRLDSKLFAAGIEIGSEYQWDVMCGLGVHAGWSAALLQGRAHDIKNEFIEFIGSTPIPVYFQFHNKRCLPIQAFEIYGGLGYDWDYDMCGCQSKFHFYLDYEFNYFAHLPSPSRTAGEDLLVNNSTHGTLILQGLTFGVSLMF